jgi:hypothetical protein
VLQAESLVALLVVKGEAAPLRFEGNRGGL